MGAHLVDPGAVLAERYVVEDLLGRDGEAESWRARDQILARSVVLQILPSTSPYAAQMLDAAKQASHVTDTRVVQVLDAVDDGALSYIVREWASGQSLDVVLAEGPLSARRATWLVREVASAMIHAHQLQLSHQQLCPDAIVLTKASGVKVIGLATAAALSSAASSGSDAELGDVQDLGRLLYACLTARWPGGEACGLPEAPTEHGRLLRPRQVRAGVPRALDAVCDRILAEQSRYGPAITTVAEVRAELSRILVEEGFTTSPGIGLQAPRAEPPTSSLEGEEAAPALLSRDDRAGALPTGAHAVERPDDSAGSSWRRSLVWTSVAVLVAGAVLLAFLIGQHGLTSAPAGTPGTTARSTSPSTPPHPLRVQAVQSFDPPPGNGDENPDEAQLSVDNDPSSAWETLQYFNNPALGLLKNGVGLVLDLGQVRTVQQVVVSLQGDGTNLQLRAAPPATSTAPADSADSYRVLDSLEAAGTTADFRLQSPVRSRFLLVWLTSLPSDGANAYRGRVADIKVMGD
ncbi:MAG: protein kinase family protein [Nocardioidaceae bacterium]